MKQVADLERLVTDPILSQRRHSEPGRPEDVAERVNVDLGQLVGAGLVDRDDVHQALTDAAQAAGVDPHEAKAQSTIRRALDAGSRVPRRIGAPT